MTQFSARIVARWLDQNRNIATIRQGQNTPDIYMALGYGNGLHVSYHRDGRYHWRVYDPTTERSLQLCPERYYEPLINLEQMQSLVNFSIDVESCPLTSWKAKKASQTLIFNVPKESPWLSVIGQVLPAGHTAELTNLVNILRSTLNVLCVHIITTTSPWIAIIMYQSHSTRDQT